MILSFKNKISVAIFEGKKLKNFDKDITYKILSKLHQIDSAMNLEDIRLPWSNHLEALEGKRKGQYSIRVNKKWRICFLWENDNAYEVEIVDYH